MTPERRRETVDRLARAFAFWHPDDASHSPYTRSHRALGFVRRRRPDVPLSPEGRYWYRWTLTMLILAGAAFIAFLLATR